LAKHDRDVFFNEVYDSGCELQTCIKYPGHKYKYKFHNSRSRTTQVLDHGQWEVTSVTQIGRLVEFYSTEKAKDLKR